MYSRIEDLTSAPRRRYRIPSSKLRPEMKFSESWYWVLLHSSALIMWPDTFCYCTFDHNCSSKSREGRKDPQKTSNVGNEVSQSGKDNLSYKCHCGLWSRHQRRLSLRKSIPSNNQRIELYQRLINIFREKEIPEGTNICYPSIGNRLCDDK